MYVFARLMMIILIVMMYMHALLYSTRIVLNGGNSTSKDSETETFTYIAKT